MSLSRSRTHLTTAAAGLIVLAGAAGTIVPAQAAEEGTATIRGIVLETGHIPGPSIDVYLYKSTGEAVGDGTVADTETGAYSFTGLESGSYLLWFDNQNEAVGEWYDNKPDKESATPFFVAEGQTYVANAYLTRVSENLVTPTVTGTASVGSTLTATRGSWYPTLAVEFRYQWRRNGVAIDGATQPTYLLRDADSGSRITVEVIAVHQGATESAVSLATATVTGGSTPVQTITNVSAPSITGSTTVGSTLTATSGTWTPGDATVTLQWMRGGTVVGTGASYTTTSADVGASLQVRATATKTGWTSAIATSTAFGPITAVVTPPVEVAPTVTGRPNVTGTARVGGKLAGTTGTWSGSPTAYRYQWTRNGVAIPGAVSRQLALTPAHAGARIGLVVTATNGVGSATSASSALTVAKASSALAVTAKSTKKKRLTFAVMIASAGARTGSVVVTVKVGGKKVTRTFAAGAVVRGTIRGLKPGKAKVSVSYSGDASTTASTWSKRVKVR